MAKKRRLEPRTCKECGNGFMARVDNIVKGHGWFCSHSCRAKAYRLVTNNLLRGVLFGERNPQWRGGVDESPERRKARNAVNNAKAAGKITSKPCAQCGSCHRLQAHHPDYSKPLDVVWLCEPCHKKLHNQSA